MAPAFLHDSESLPGQSQTSQRQRDADGADVAAAGERRELPAGLLLVEFARLRAMPIGGGAYNVGPPV